MQLFIEEYTYVFFYSPMDRYRYYRSILTVMLATGSMDPSVKFFSLFTEILIIGPEKNFSLVKSNHFFSSKDHQSNQHFFTVNLLSISIQSMFFSPSLLTYGGEHLQVKYSLDTCHHV
jgi:hypothetical protein